MSFVVYVTKKSLFLKNKIDPFFEFVILAILACLLAPCVYSMEEVAISHLLVVYFVENRLYFCLPFSKERSLLP